MITLKIVWKFFFAQISLILISLLTIGFYLGYSLKNYYVNQISSQLTTNAILVRNMIDKDVVEGGVDSVDAVAKRIGNETHSRITIIDREGTVIGDSEKDPRKMENHIDRPEIRDALTGMYGKSIRYSETLDIEMIYLAIPMTDNGKINRVIRISLSLDHVNERITHIYKIIGWGTLLAILISLGIGFLFAKRMSRPITQMTRVARKISEGNFSERIRANSTDEIGDLARSFNSMSIELQKRIKSLSKEIGEKQAILSGMIEGVIAADSDQRIILFNTAAETMFNVSSRKALGRFYWEVIRHSGFNAVFQEVLDTGNPKTEEITLQYEGEKILHVQAAAITDEKKEHLAVVAVFHDITEIRRLERVRKEFVANVTHELRTPLTSIKGFVETLRDGAINDPENSLKFLNIIATHTDRLNQLLSDLLELSQIESGRTEMNLEPINIMDVINRVVSVFADTVHQRKQSITIDIQEDFPFVLVDEEKVEIVLINLLDNAVKYTPDNGEITVSAFDKGNNVQIEVSDTGMGIPDAELPRIFERFYRVDKARSRELGGTGLGLSIVKHIVDAHGGTVHAESEMGKGTRIIFTLLKSME
ncbi:MAG: ATP-binding protein [Thermodesulfobacteriota bacterium]|nr:ATP-binding protein [Thermodesulfobacteriota bacterium]